MTSNTITRSISSQRVTILPTLGWPIPTRFPRETTVIDLRRDTKKGDNVPSWLQVTLQSVSETRGRRFVYLRDTVHHDDLLPLCSPHPLSSDRRMGDGRSHRGRKYTMILVHDTNEWIQHQEYFHKDVPINELNNKDTLRVRDLPGQIGGTRRTKEESHKINPTNRKIITK